TREKIVEAAMQLHGELGPRATTISAVAERAGVQRLTVYRHFPDDNVLFQACSARWLELHPPPLAAQWQALAEPRERTRRALAAFYDYYKGTGNMWERVYRDADLPALQEPLARFHAYLDGIAADLLGGWKAAGCSSRELKAVIRHCLEFATWRSLNEQRVGNRRASELATAWIEASARQE